LIDQQSHATVQSDTTRLLVQRQVTSCRTCDDPKWHGCRLLPKFPPLSAAHTTQHI